MATGVKMAITVARTGGDLFMVMVKYVYIVANRSSDQHVASIMSKACWILHPCRIDCHIPIPVYIII